MLAIQSALHDNYYRPLIDQHSSQDKGIYDKIETRKVSFVCLNILALEQSWVSVFASREWGPMLDLQYNSPPKENCSHYTVV